MPVLLTKQFSPAIADIDEEIRRRLLHGDSNSFLCIVPTKRKVRELQREFLGSVPRGIAPAFSLFTLETLAAELYSLLCPPRRFVSGPMQAVLMQEAIRSVEGSLRYFRIRKGNRSLPRGTFQKIINVINHLKDRGVYRSGLYAEAEAAEIDEKAKLHDILVINEAYEQQLGENYIDTAGVMKEVNLRWDAKTSEEMFYQRFKGCTTLFVSGFDEFSDPELTMIHHLSNMQHLGTVISFDYHLENDHIFGHLKENYQKLLAMGFDKRKADDGTSTSFQEYIARHLFHTDSVMTPLPCKDNVTLLKGEDREHEVELIAKLIKRLVHDNPDVDLSKICVSMVRPQKYTALFREVFDRYGIPANITDRYNLDQSPLIVAILSLLEMQQRNFRLGDIMRALSTPYLDFTREGRSIDVGNLYTVAAMLKISSGKKTWINRITQRLALLDEQLASPEDEIENEKLQREQAMLRKAHDNFERLEMLMQRFRDAMTPQEFKTRLYSLVDDLNVLERMFAVPGIEPMQLEKDTRAFQKFFSFIDEFLDILAIEGEQTARNSLAFYVDRLKLAMTQVRYNVRQKYGYGVYVTSFDETRGLKFDVMMIAGLVDGEFPPLYAHEFLFSTVRQQQHERNHLREHRYLFYQALTNFTRRVYLTFPARDGDIELVPSSFIDAVCNIVDLDDRRKELPKNLVECLYSEDELLKYLGASIGHGRAFSSDDVPVGKLRETFDHMRRAVGVENSRMGGTPLPEFNGEILQQLDMETRRTLERFRHRVYSVTQLESYGRCPFQFFADKVLQLNVTTEFDEGLSPLERGSMLHEILFEFYTHRRDQGLPPLHLLGESQFQDALNGLLAIAHEKLDAMVLADVFWEVDKEMILGSDARKGLLQDFLEVERGRKFETSPAFFEVAFGLSGGSKKNIDRSLGMTSPVEIEGVALRGKIDRVDAGDNIFTIIDYKSGSSSPDRSDIEKGISLQIPIYLYVVERMIAEVFGKKLNGAAGIYYTLKTPVRELLGIGNKEYLGKAFNAKSHNKQLAENEDELHLVIRQAIAFVHQYVDSIVHGAFPVAPKDPHNVCKYCDFKTICRVQLQQAVPIT